MEWKEEDHKKKKQERQKWDIRGKGGGGGGVIMKRVFNEAVQDHHQRLLIHWKRLQTGAGVVARLWPAERQGIYPTHEPGCVLLSLYQQTGSWKLQHKKKYKTWRCNPSAFLYPAAAAGELHTLPQASTNCQGNSTHCCAFWGWIAHNPCAIYSVLLSHSGPFNSPLTCWSWQRLGRGRRQLG